tara:strand:+ start:64683 stop:65597 length:915 start_codon:yes stop_codon:yes gene_type:complete
LKKLKYKDPILLSGADGVGTKLLLAIEHNNFKGIGFDLVAMCVNDILVNGGEPLFFLDYIATSKLNTNILLKIIKSIKLACTEAGCSLVGGETAEMPGLYKPNEFDLAGFCVGAVERENLIKKKKVKINDLIYGIESSGFHSNGFSLIRKILKKRKITLGSKPPYFSKKKNFGDDLLVPTKIYTKLILPLVKKNLVNSMAHITGGGIVDNISRIIPVNKSAHIETKNFQIPKKFLWLSEFGNIKNSEMLKTFNCGIGLALIISKDNESKFIDYMNKQKVNFYKIGHIKRQDKSKIIIRNFGIWK